MIYLLILFIILIEFDDNLSNYFIFLYKIILYNLSTILRKIVWMIYYVINLHLYYFFHIIVQNLTKSFIFHFYPISRYFIYFKSYKYYIYLVNLHMRSNFSKSNPIIFINYLIFPYIVNFINLSSFQMIILLDL